MARRPASRSVQVVAVALGAGLVLGGAVSALAFLLARYGPVGAGWSFRGNGALATYTLMPVLLAGGWTAIVLHHRGRPWLPLAAVAAGVGLLLAVADAALLPLFGVSADVSAGPVLLLALVAWSVVAPVVAMRTVRTEPGGASVGASLGAAFLWALGLAAGLIGIGLAFPAGS